MAEKLPVAERVERQLLANLASITGVNATYRWDEHGNKSGSGDGMIVMDNATVEEDGDGPSTTLVRQQFQAGVMVSRDKDDSDVGAFVKNRFIARIKEKILADTELTEDATGERLALDIRFMGTPPPLKVAGKPRFWAIAAFEVAYIEDRSDPYTGPGVTERTA